MDGTIVAIVGVILTPAATVLVAWMKIRKDHITIRADRIDLLEKRVDEEIATRREAQTQAYQAGVALRKALDCLRAFQEWLEAGAKPPPPSVPDLRMLEKALPETR